MSLLLLPFSHLFISFLFLLNPEASSLSELGFPNGHKIYFEFLLDLLRGEIKTEMASLDPFSGPKI